MKLSKYRLLDLAPTLVAVLFGAPLLLIFTAKSIQFTPLALRWLPWTALAVVAAMTLLLRVINQRVTLPLHRFFQQGASDERTVHQATVLALNYPLIRGVQLFAEFMVGGPLVVLLLMLLRTGTTWAVLQAALFPSFVTALTVGVLVYLTAEALLQPFIYMLAMAEKASQGQIVHKAIRITVTRRLVALFLVVMVLSFVFGLAIARYPGIWYVTILGIVSTVAIAVLTARNINKTVTSISNILHSITEGRGGITQSLPVTSNDELGDLCREYNNFMGRFKQLVEDITKAAVDLAASSEELAASSQQMNASAEEISSTVQQISKGASTQSERLTQVAKEVERLSSAIKQIDSLGRMTTVSSQKSIEASKNGGQKTAEIVGKMAEIYQSSTWATQQVQGLQQKSKEISTVINLISNIAQQTDFLALNAAIEAARAGDAGKGFSVVADEIRTLAVEAGNSAQQVTALIRDIEKEITKTVEGITQSQQIIESSRTAVDQTEQSLKVINSTVAVAGTMVKQMAEASRNQSESAGHVVTLASEVSTISIETASSTQEVAAAVEQQTASMEELSALSQTLSQTAENLSALVKRFRSDKES
ncbi:MAG TPA: methyl-accepting chemotaxis protein [Candidatus Edwardsbacteria bacterium]|nr:methyl-accepting chemotaxis protein [Candidatus Edwardsbacteria bacterium]